MTSSMGRGAGFRGSLAGIVVGGLSWIVMAGLSIRDILLWAPAIALGAGLHPFRGESLCHRQANPAGGPVTTATRPFIIALPPGMIG